MGLFGKPKDERKVLKGQIDKLMKDYSKEKIDGDTYFHSSIEPIRKEPITVILLTAIGSAS